MSTMTVDDSRAAPALQPLFSYFGDLTDDAYGALGSMEGMYHRPVVETARSAAAHERLAHWPGYLFAAAVCAVAYGIHYLPFAPFQVVSDAGVKRPISTAILAILVGLLVRNFIWAPASILAGCKSIVRGVIPFAIVLTGAELHLSSVLQVGPSVLMIIVVCIALSMGAAYVIGRMMKLPRHTALLVGAGTGICGSSAIVAVAPLLETEDDDLAWSIGAINALGLIVMLLWPVVGEALRLSSSQFGVWAGTSIHAVPQVVTAGLAFSSEAGAMATLVKLVRVTMLAPLVFALALAAARRRRATGAAGERMTVHYGRMVPWFVWGFLGLSLLYTEGLIPELKFPAKGLLGGGGEPFVLPLVRVLKETGTALLALAMAAIGLELSVKSMARVGKPVFLCAAGATVVLGAASLVLVKLLL